MNNFRELAKEPTPEELEEMRRDGMNPLTGSALVMAMMKSGPSKDGIDFSKYVPRASIERFLRFRQAKFNLAEFERLNDMDYPQTILLRWMLRADSKAESDYMDAHKDD